MTWPYRQHRRAKRLEPQRLLSRRPATAAGSRFYNERSRALARFEIIRPFLEDAVPLAPLARERNIVLRTARRWVERYRRSGNQ
jgi:hypothetical protein